MDPDAVPDIVELWRRSYYFAMKSGDTVVLHIDKSAPDFLNKFNGPKFPVPTIFNKAEITKREVYKTLLKEGEDKDNFGNEGGFYMDDKFKVALLCTRDTDDTEDFKDRIPMELCKIIKIVP